MWKNSQCYSEPLRLVCFSPVSVRCFINLQMTFSAFILSQATTIAGRRMNDREKYANNMKEGEKGGGGEKCWQRGKLWHTVLWEKSYRDTFFPVLVTRYTPNIWFSCSGQVCFPSSFFVCHMHLTLGLLMALPSLFLQDCINMWYGCWSMVQLKCRKWSVHTVTTRGQCGTRTDLKGIPSQVTLEEKKTTVI